MRIVTLLPSATDLVLALGQGNKLVGVSHSCDQPHDLPDIRRVTSTRVPYQSDSLSIDNFVRDHLQSSTALYDLDLDALKLAAPDVIVSQGLCDVCAVATGDVEEALCALPSNPIIVDLNPHRLNDILDDLQRLGEALECRNLAASLRKQWQERIDAVVAQTSSIPTEKRPRVGFLEWLIPPFNGGHWNPEIINAAGGIDLFGNPGQPSATIDWNLVEQSNADTLLIACCGLSVERTEEDLGIISKDTCWSNLRAVKNDRVFLADGNDNFARPGPSVVEAIERLAVTLHPQLKQSIKAQPFSRWAG